MKKTLFLGALLLAAFACAARPAEAKKTVRTVPVEKAYNGVRVSSMVRVVLDDRDPASVEVIADARLSDRVVVEVRRGILDIRMKGMNKRERKRKDEHFAATVVYVGREPVRSVEIDGMASLTSEKELVGDAIVISASGMSKVKAPLKCGSATLRIDGMSKLEADVACSGELRVAVGGMSKASLSGEALRMVAEVAGMSKLDADDLDVTEYADCSVYGMSKAHVTCNGELMARTEGMSKLSYSGNATLAAGSQVSDSSLKKR